MSHLSPCPLLTAVRVKEAMKQIPSSYPSIGRVVRVPFASFKLGDFPQDQNENPKSSSSESSNSSSEAESQLESQGSRLTSNVTESAAALSSSLPLSSTNPTKNRKRKRLSARPLTHRFYECLYRLLVPCGRKSVDDEEIKEIIPDTQKINGIESYIDREYVLKGAFAKFWLFVSIPNHSDCDYVGSITDIKEELLQKWWEHGHVSGYGNVCTQTNDVNASVRNAREWRGDEIRVSEIVVDTLALIWSKTMQPADVRVQLYKLNVYGPGGRFIAHKDTPETDLIGTILVGLGETTDAEAGLKVEGRKSLWRATPGSHIMFYPDVPHEVLSVTRGYRATLAFKVFRGRGNDLCLSEFPRLLGDWHYSVTERRLRTKSFNMLDRIKDYKVKRESLRDATAALLPPNSASSSYPAKDALHMVTDAVTSYTSLKSQLCKELKANLATRCTPFGFLLDSQYALGTKDLHGPDQVLYEILCGFPELRVIVLPVLTKYSAELRYTDDRDNEEHYHKESAVVFPLTDAHVRGVLQKEIPSLATACGISQAEADQMKEVPIVSLNIRKGYEWHRSREGSEFTGNETHAEVENSIWFHRAIIVVRRSSLTYTESRTSTMTRMD